MNKTSPLVKRVRRQVAGRVQQFYVATLPGLSFLTLEELKSLPLEADRITPVEGGIEFRGKMSDLYLASLHLKTANRILMRVGDFRAVSFKQLQKAAEQIPWELYLCPGAELEIRTTARRSRLIHSDAISQRIGAAISKVLCDIRLLPEWKGREAVQQKLFVRAVKDRFTVSLDTSGELLYKRGLKKSVGRAPLRETLGAAVLMLAGYRGDEPLIDPMCGSGTFSLEAAMVVHHLPAGGFRDFAFMGWPGFRKRQWEFIKKQALGNYHKKGEAIFASDTDPKSVEGLRTVLNQHPMVDSIFVRQADFNDLDPNRMAQHSGLVVLNPPYGRRLKTADKNTEALDGIWKKLAKDFRGWRVAILLPEWTSGKKMPFSMKRFSLVHGGLKLNLMTGTLPV